MQTFTKELPAMYGDHHVVEVRRILLDLPGVEDVYASSAFRVVDVQYDPEKVSEDQIEERLVEAGYAGEIPMLAETGKSATMEDRIPFSRHTAVYKQASEVVTFTQSVSSMGRPLWPCPGVGVVSKQMEE